MSEIESSSPPENTTKLNLYDFFESTQVVSLEKFPERTQAFKDRAEEAGVSGYEIFAAIEGDKSAPPVWWRAGKGAWGCMMSHLHIVQRHLTSGNGGHLLLFEDDCVFSSNFSTQLPIIMEELGDDWDMIYFGGQHLHSDNHPPTRPAHKEHIVKPYDVNRTHAFAVHSRFMEKYQQHISHAPDYIEKSWVMHIDHQLGQLCRSGVYGVYAAQPWICGQAAGKSWTCGRQVGEMWWQLRDAEVNDYGQKPAGSSTPIAIARKDG